MEEKKKFILAIPTIIIIFATIIGVSLIFYNRNFKSLSREDVKLLTRKVAAINNISCEIVTEGNEVNSNNVMSYKLKDNRLLIKTNYYTIYDDQDLKHKVQIDEDEKTAYVYSEYQSEIVNFEEMLCMANQLIENEDYEYKFNNYETMNGVKCVNFTLSNNASIFNIWLDKSNGMIAKIECVYHTDDAKDIKNIMYYRYQLDSVKEEDVTIPNLDKYVIVDL